MKKSDPRSSSRLARDRAATPLREMLYERLEDRVMFDAVPDASGEMLPQDPADADQHNAQQFDTSAQAEDVKVVSDGQPVSEEETVAAEQVRRELVIVDTSVENYQELVADLLNEDDPLQEIDVITIDGFEDGIVQVTQILERYSDLDAVHLVSHGDDAGVNLGNVWLTRENLGTYAAEIAQWSNAFAEDGDLLLLGCDLAETDDGRELLRSLSTLTGTDVAASKDDTGYALRGGDWDLEFLIGSLETTIAFSQEIQTNWQGLLAPGPNVTLNVPSQVPLGEDVNFSVTFQNTGPSGDVGYGPFIDVLIPHLGSDGEFDGAGFSETPDGLDVAASGAVTYLGQAVNYEVLTFGDDDGAGGLSFGVIDHPFATAIQNETQLLGAAGIIDGGTFTLSFDGNTTGAIAFNANAATIQAALESLAGIDAGDVNVTGGTLPGQEILVEFTGNLAQTDVSQIAVDSGNLTGGGTVESLTIVDGDAAEQALRVYGRSGEKLVVIELPFGSFTPEQPAATVNIAATMSTLADLSEPLSIRARGGFRFGADALNNPDVDPLILSDSQRSSSNWVESQSVTPTLLEITKANNAPESETATGPNYVRQWTVNVNIPDGQTITDLDIFDDLPNNIVFLSLDSITSTDGGANFTTNVPVGLNSLGQPANNTAFTGSNGFPSLNLSGPQNGQSLVITADSVTGTAAGTDVSITFSFYVAEFDANGDRVIPIDGEDDTTSNPDSRSRNNARVQGDFTPVDTRDAGGTDNAVADPAGFENTVDDASIAIQKSVTVVDTGGIPTGEGTAVPGSILRYTLSFQISDYYTYGDLVLTDIFSDGQLFYDLLGPTFSVSDFDNTHTNQSFNVHIGAQNTPPGAPASANFIVDQSDIDTGDNGAENLATAGTTTLTIELSEALALIAGEDGILEGGLTNGGTNLGPATGTITFYTQVQDEFNDTFASGDRSVDQGDVLSNSVTIDGTVRENQEDDANSTLFETLHNESDTSSAGIQVARGTLSKSIYAINGSTTIGSPVEVAPGDTVTYRLTYTLPTSDFEDLVITDFFPLPVFTVGDPDADDVGGPAWTFDADQSSNQLLPGVVEVLAINGAEGDTFYDIWDQADNGMLDDSIAPLLSVDTNANSLEIDFGTFDQNGFQASQIDLLLTVTVQDDPFADGLFLTNQAQATEGTTNGTPANQVDLVQIQLTEPVVATINKGIVDTDGTAAFDTGGVTFAETEDTAGFTGVINSDWLQTETLTTLVSDLDGGDTARFVVIVENIGSSRKGAFDVAIADALGPGFSYLDNSLRVFDGTGAALTFSGADNDLFAGGITLDDPGATPGQADGTDSGALDEFDAANGRNIAVLIYDVTIDSTAQPLEQIDNTATLLAYAGTEGGENHVVTPPEATAGVTIANVDAAKTIVATSESHTGQEGGTERVTIGEIVRYRIAVAVPEGTLPELTLRDRLPGGLTFIDDGTATIAFVSDNGAITSSTLTGAGLAMTGNETTLAGITPSFVLPDSAISENDDPGDENDTWATGNDPYFKLGNIVNTDNDANLEYVVIEFNALVDNNSTGSQNDTDEARRNDLEIFMDSSGNGTIESSEELFDLPDGDRPLVRIVEPLLENIAQSVDASTGDAGDTVTFTVTFDVADGNTRADAFDVRLQDVLPAGELTFVGGSLMINVGATLLAAGTDYDDNTAGNTLDFSIHQIAKGEAVTITYQATIDDDVNPNDVIGTRANLAWTSLPDTGTSRTDTTNNPTGSDLASLDNLDTSGDATPEYNTQSGEAQGERNGSGQNDPATAADDAQPNDYHGSVTSNITIASPAFLKEFVSTSVTAGNGSGVNGDSEAVIGELIQYRFTITVPEGETVESQVFDQLGEGLEFVGIDGITASADLTSTVGNLDNSGITDFENAINQSGSGAAGDAQSLTFNFGTITNANRDNAQDEEIVVTYTVRVLDIAANQSTANESGPTLNNTARFQWDSDGNPGADEQTANSSAAGVSIIEPIVEIEKEVVSVDDDAGNPIVYTITINHDTDGSGTDSEADAFDLTFFDNVPEEIILNASSLNVVHTRDVLISDRFEIVGNRVQTKAGESFDLLTDETVIVTINGTIASDVGPGQTISNRADIDWTSLDGVQTGERSGADGISGTPNNYATFDIAEFTIARPETAKVLVSTSIDNSGTTNTNDNTQAVVGETAIYRVTVTIPEGQTDAAQIIDSLDLGLQFEDIVSVSASANVTSDTVDFTDASSISVTTDGDDGITAAQQITFHLGTITNSNSNAADEQIVIEYRVRVTNSTAIGTDTGQENMLDNSALFQWDLGGSQGVQQTDSAIANAITVIEPDLNISSSVVVDGAGTQGDAGDSVVFTIDFAHASISTDAFDVTFTDAVSDRIDYNISDVSVILTRADTTTTDITNLFEVLPDGTLQTISSPQQSFDLLAGETVQIVINGQLNGSAIPNEQIDHTASIRWTSLNDDEVSGSATSLERDGESGAGTAPNDYVETSNNSSLTINPPQFAKTLFATDQTETSGSNVTIGETVTYALRMELPEGTAPGVTVVDLLPDGLDYTSFAIITDAASSNGLLTADFNGTIGGGDPSVTGGNGSGDDVTFSFGSLSVNSDNDGTNNAFLILVDALVLDVPGNTGFSGSQTTLANSATLDITSDGVAPQSSGPVTVTVVEPSLRISKEFGPTVDVDEADAGNTVSIVLIVDNTGGTSAAYDVVIQDILGSADYDLSTVNFGVSGTDYPADFTANFNSGTGLLEYSGGTIAAGATVTFTFTVDLADTVTPGSTLTNTATISAGSSLEGVEAGERNAPDADGDGSDTDADTVRIRRNSLAGFVFDDADNDGVFDAGESGLVGVEVQLTGTDHLSNSVDITVMTTAGGAYLFDNLRPGTYAILEDPDGDSIPAGFLDGIDTIGTPGGNFANDSFSNISLPTGTETHGTNNNFGEIQASMLSGAVYHDADNDGIFDGTETGIDGVQVRLTGTDDLGQTVDITVSTAGGGFYTFANLRPSDAAGYTIIEADEPVGFLDGRDTDGSLANGDAASVNNQISSINVIPGDDGTGYNFGEVIGSTLSGFVYHDSDNDGDRTDEPGTNGIQNVQITLTGIDDLGNAVNLTTMTDGNGFYDFTDLRPSDGNGYTIAQTSTPAGFLDGIDTIGTPGGDDTVNDRFSSILIVSDTTGTENNFGELLPASLSGTVFIDHDNDGAFEPGDGETRIANATVRLTGTNDLGNAVDVMLQTDGNGNYTFSNLRPSDASGYTMTQTQPANYNDGIDSDGSLANGNTGANDVISSIDVVSGDAGTGYNFAERGATLSGTVFVDGDRDGVLDGGEPNRIGGVVIELYDSTGTKLIDSTVTAPDGTYSFDHLPAGDYQMRQQHPAQYTSTSPDTLNVTLPLGGLSGQNFGEALFDLGDVVYFDANNNGVQDAGEEGLAGVEITLLYAGANGSFGDGDDVTQTDTTDANGLYDFTELFNGAYRVTVSAGDLPAGMTGTQESDDSAAAIDGTSNITLNGADRFDVDFGYTGNGVIGDFVFLDVNADGVQDADEPGLANITVNLTFAGADGMFGNDDDLTLSTETDSAGGYTFANLPAGEFRIDVDTMDPDLPTSITPVSGAESISGTAIVSLAADETNTVIDFGFAGTLSVGDRLWLDQNGDGVQGAGEPGLAESEVTLLFAGQDGIFGNADDVTLTDTTDANGNYQFANLADGDFRISYNAAQLPAGLTPTFEVDGSTNNQAEITLAGSDRDNVDFGFQGAGAIGDFVWLDVNGDGLQDANEPGLADVDVVLTFEGADGVFGNADDFSITTATDANGSYQFEGLPNGDYQITVDANDADLPTGLTGVSGAQSTNGTAGVTLDALQRNVDDVDFGFAGTRTVGDFVWFDVDGDGNQDADEPGLGLVDLTLTFAGQDGIFGNADDVQIMTTTDANGGFQFTQLPDGDYRIAVDAADLPTGVAATFDVDGTLDNRGDFAINGGSRSDADFGYTGNLSLGDRFWYDADADGNQDAGEPGLSGVDVTLLFAGANDVFGDADDFQLDTTTGANGIYNFANLPQGELRITYDAGDLPNGMNEITAETDDSAAAFDGTANIALNVNRNDVDFGFRGNGAIGDLIFFDTNNDGIQDANDRGLPGVDVTAEIDIDGDTIVDYSVTVTTDNDGAYLFENLVAGTYTLTIDTSTLPTGFAAFPTADPDGLGTPHTAQLNLSVDETNAEQDFGYYAASMIGDTVFLDRNGNGLQETSEFGIGNVDVQLTWYGPDDLLGTSDDEVFIRTTDENGIYLFDGRPEGFYRVDVIEASLPLGVMLTTGNEPLDFFLPDGDSNLDADFGYQGEGEIGDFVFFDLNGDGVFDSATETGYPGVTVTIAGDFDGDGFQESFETVTDANGIYQVSGLPHGNYTVTLTPPTGTNPTIDADGIGTPNQSGLTLDTTNPANDAQDFGLTGTGTITDAVFFDLDGDGQFDADEPGIPGVTVDVEIDLDGDGAADLTVTVETDQDGEFTLAGLPAGTHTVIVTPPAGSQATSDLDSDMVADTQADVITTPGATSNTGSFGYRGDASIGDIVFYDADGNGVPDVGEPGLPNVEVSLEIDFNADGMVDHVLATTTDDDGQYEFTNLPAGNYAVVVTQPTGTDPTEDADGIGTPNVSRLSLAASEINNDQDFAYTGTGTIADNVFFDVDGNGLFDGADRGLENVNVTLSIDLNGDGVPDLTTTTVTNADGEFLFENLIPGTYTITTDPDDMPPGLANNPSVDNDGTETPHTAEYSLGADDNLTGTGFGFHATPDYEITKTANASDARPGDVVQYVIRVQNIGELDGRNVVIVDNYPADVLNILDASGGVVDQQAGTIAWEIPGLNPGEEFLLVVTAEVINPATAGVDAILNSVRVRDDGFNGQDPDPANNESTVSTLLDAAPDYRITVTDELVEAGPGDPVTYTIVVSNDGNQVGTGVVVTSELPPGLLINVMANLGGVYDPATGIVTWDLGGLAAGESVILTIDAVIASPIPSGFDLLTNTASVSDDGRNGPDRTPENNVDEDVTELPTFAFDSFQNFNNLNSVPLNFGLDPLNLIPAGNAFQNRLSPLPIDTVYTGIVDPGTTLSGKIYDQQGRLVGEQIVVADSAGNWLMQFPSVVLYEQPHEMRIEQTLAVQNSSSDAGFNLRRFFHPAIHTQLFLNDSLSVGGVFREDPHQVLQAMHEANNHPLSFGWHHHSYELLVSSSNTSQF